MTKVIIKRQGNLIEAAPREPVMPIVDKFVFRRLIDRMDSYGRRRGRMLGNPEPLFQLEGDDRVVIPAGLYYRMKANMDSMGVDYEYRDLRNKMWPEPDYENIFRQGYTLRPGQDEIVAKLATCEIGRFQNPTGDGKTFIITMLALLFPKAKILIVTDGLSAFDSLFRRLMKITPNVGRVGGGKCEIEQITLCNKNSLHRVPGDEYDFCLVDECHTMAETSVAPKFAAITNAKIFGFSATQQGRGDKSDFLTEAMFGPIIHEVEYQTSVARGNISQIHVLMYPCPNGPDTDGIKQDVTRKRRAYWRNPDRNQLIAKIAQEVIPPDEQQLIMVSTIEHLLRLRKLLPGWTAVYRPPSSKATMEAFIMEGLITKEEILTRKQLNQIEIAFENGELKRVIANSVWHKAVDFPQLEYLIRADGSVSEIETIQISGRLSRLHGDNVKHLIDFTDGFDRICQDRAITRRRLYKKQGWIVEDRVLGQPIPAGV